MQQQLSSAQLISHHRSRPDYISSDSNTIQFAYGDHRYTKFTYQLLNQSLPLQQKILKQIEQDFSLCNNIDQCLKSSDLLTVLFKHIQNENVIIRTLSTKCIAKVCVSQYGKNIIIKRQLIEKYQKLIDDQISEIRQAAMKGLINFAQSIQGIDVLLQSQKILGHLVDKLIEQKNIFILRDDVILTKILMQGEQGIPKALGTEVIGRLMKLIEHQSSQIRYNVCIALANISFNQYGKQRIVQQNYIKGIVPSLQDQNQLVRQAACLLLCSLSQLNQGKIQILQLCQFKVIIDRLDDTAPTVLNAVQLIANLAENPKGRKFSSDYINKIDALDCIQRKYVDATLDVIRWKP